jgi:tetratricopeptide (TPR) repeat protein
MRVSSFVIILLILFSSCFSKKEIIESKRDFTKEEYYATFTEATKFALLGNMGEEGSLRRALQLYNLCIREFPEKAAPYYQISNIYLTAGNIQIAKSYGRKAVEIDDNNKWYLLHLANIYQYESNLDSLIYYYEKINLVTENPEYKYNLALFYSANKQFDKSLKIISELEKELAGSRELFVIKHKNYAAMNLPDSAVSELNKLVYFFPEQFENYGMLAEYLSEINRTEESKKVYETLIEREPYNGLANLSFGDFYLKQNDKKNALIYYKKGFQADDITIEDKIGILYNYMHDGSIIKSDTIFYLELVNVLVEKYDDPRPYALLAEFYINHQKYMLAIDNLFNAIKSGSENYIIWEQYIMISNFIGKNENVKNIYEEAINKFPGEINLYIFSSYSLYVLEEYLLVLDLESSGRDIKIAELDQRVQFLNVIADAYRGIDNLAQSDSIYEEILLMDPNNLLIRNNYSYYLAIRGKKLERAEELSRLTIRVEANNATYLDTYGWILYKQGKVKEALKFIESAIKNGAYNNSEVLEHYGDIMVDLDRCKEAIEAWNEALKYVTNGNSEKIEQKISNTKLMECYE